VSNANSKQVAGDHYRTASSGLQHWDICAEHDVPYLEGCATKYLSRFRRKGGLQDLQKAAHYIEKRLENAGRRHPYVPAGKVIAFLDDNGIFGPEREIIRILLNWTVAHDLIIAHDKTLDLIAVMDGSAPGGGYVNQD